MPVAGLLQAEVAPQAGKQTLLGAAHVDVLSRRQWDVAQSANPQSKRGWQAKRQDVNSAAPQGGRQITPAGGFLRHK
jgi:hypothetical protein